MMHPPKNRSLPLLLLAASLSACGLITDNDDPAAIRITPSQAALGVRDSLLLVAIVVDESGGSVDAGRISWSSSNPAVASVDSRGLVTGIAPGDVQIRAAVRGRSAEVPLTIEARGFVHLALGDRHSCGITVTQRAFCWGAAGLIGDGRPVEPDEVVTRPTPVAGDLRFASLSAGWAHTCGITVDGSAYCWGGNVDGLLGTGDGAHHSEPAPVAGGIPFRHISAGNTHTCGVAQDGTAYCWGDNRFSQLGLGEAEHRIDRDVPTPVLTNVRFVSVDAGRNSTCGVSDTGAVYCWGDGALGTEGDFHDGVSWTAYTPVRIPDFPGRAAQADGYFPMRVPIWAFSCGLDALGALYCWQNEEWEGVRIDPTPIADGPFQEISLSGDTVCALGLSGRAACWRAGRWDTPLHPADGFLFVSIERGQWHACGLARDGLAHCWGSNGYGQLGDGSLDGVGVGDQPVQVVEPE